MEKVMRRLVLLLLGVALLASACGDSFDCTVVQCDGLYQAEGDEGTVEFLRFWADGTAVWAPFGTTPNEPNISVDSVAQWLNKDYRDFSGGKYSIDGDSIEFSTQGYSPNSFEGSIEGATLVIMRQETTTGVRHDRTFTFVPVTFS
jgi:hypothetical protein